MITSSIARGLRVAEASPPTYVFFDRDGGAGGVDMPQ